MGKTGQYKRKNYFINKEFQGRYIFNYFILLALGSVLFVVIFSFFSSNTLSIVYDNYHLQLGTTPGILFKKMLSTQWLFIVIGGITVIFITMHLTHRVAGPFFRFEKGLDEMMNNDISKKIILRQKDEGKDLAQKINAFNFALSKQLLFIDDQNSKIALSVEKLETALSQAEQSNESGQLKESGQSENDSREILRLIVVINKSQKNIETEVNKYTFNTTHIS